MPNCQNEPWPWVPFGWYLGGMSVGMSGTLGGGVWGAMVGVSWRLRGEWQAESAEAPCLDLYQGAHQFKQQKKND